MKRTGRLSRLTLSQLVTLPSDVICTETTWVHETSDIYLTTVFWAFYPISCVLLRLHHLVNCLHLTDRTLFHFVEVQTRSRVQITHRLRILVLTTEVRCRQSSGSGLVL